jgi:hypothetical protein
MNRAGGKKPPEARIRPLWGQRQLEIKGSNIGAGSCWSVDLKEEGLENRHNFQVTTT